MHLAPIQTAPFAGQPRTLIEPPVSMGGGFEAVLQMLTPGEPLVAGPKVGAVADGPGEGESLEGEGLANVGSIDQPAVQPNGVEMLLGVLIAEAPPNDIAAGRSATGHERGRMVDGRDDDPASPAELGSAPQPLPVAADLQIVGEDGRDVPAESFATKSGGSPAYGVSEGDVARAGVIAASGPANVDGDIEHTAALTLPPAAASAPSSQGAPNEAADAPRAVLMETREAGSHPLASFRGARKGEVVKADPNLVSVGISQARESADPKGKPSGAAKATMGGVTGVQTDALEGRSGNTGMVAPTPLIGSTEAGADVQTLRSMADRGQMLRSVEPNAEAETFTGPTRSMIATASDASQAGTPQLPQMKLPDFAAGAGLVRNTVTPADPPSEKAVVAAPLTTENALAGPPAFVVAAPDANVAAPLTQGGTRPISVPATMAQIADVIVAQRDGTTEITLNPHELGRVKVTISGDSSDLQVGLIVERPETLDLVRRHADLLVRELRDNGVAQSRIDFTAQDDASRGSPAQGGADRGGHGSAQRDPSRAGSDRGDALHADTANDSGWPTKNAPGAARGGQAGSGRLDIRI